MYGESIDVRLHVTWVTLKGQSQGQSYFEALYLVKEQSLIMCYY